MIKVYFYKKNRVGDFKVTLTLFLFRKSSYKKLFLFLNKNIDYINIFSYNSLQTNEIMLYVIKFKINKMKGETAYFAGLILCVYLGKKQIILIIVLTIQKEID